MPALAASDAARSDHLSMSICPYVSGPEIRQALFARGLSQIPEGLLLDTQEADLLLYIDDRSAVCTSSSLA